MRKYETVYILRPDLDEATVEAMVAKMNDTITANAGTVEQTDKWGLKKLAYAINDYREGSYVVVNFTGDNTAVKALDYVAKVSDAILRCMTIRIDE
jgi:small subunit ribosomal protein S6